VPKEKKVKPPKPEGQQRKPRKTKEQKLIVQLNLDEQGESRPRKRDEKSKDFFPQFRAEPQPNHYGGDSLQPIFDSLMDKNFFNTDKLPSGPEQ